MTDLDKLEALANRCTSGDPWYKEGDLCGRQTFDQFIPQDRAFIAAASPATILDLIASARRDAEEIERLRIAIEGEKLNYDGAISDLESALQVLARRINGEKDLDSARTWLELNYPDFAASALTARAAHTGEG